MKSSPVLRLISIALLLVLSACSLPSTTSSPEVLSPSPSPTSAWTTSTRPNEFITVAQLNFWFRGPGCGGGFEAFDCSGQRNNALLPALGASYDNASRQVIEQQIDWANLYGVDAFSIEWTTPRGIPGSLEHVLDDNFLKTPSLSTVRWCIFYDLVLRVMQTPGLQVDLSRGMDFNDPDVYNIFLTDFDHFALKYFGHDQYLKIDGRPVVYIWGTWNATGRFVDAFKEARQKVADRGFDVYLVGDVILQDHFNPDLASVYDADTNFVFFFQGPNSKQRDVGEAAVNLDRVFTDWEKKIAGMKVKGREEEVILQPGFMPQFDNRLFIQVNHETGQIYIPAADKDQVTAMAEVVRNHAHPAGPSGTKLIWLNTWNNWPETTTFEPTADQGPKYPAGNYQYDMVEVIRDVFGPEVFLGVRLPNPNPTPVVFAATEAVPTTVPVLPSEPVFSGTWVGIDSDDGSEMTMVLTQDGSNLTGTFKDAYSGSKPPPGFEGSGEGTVTSATHANITFHLKRHDGASTDVFGGLTLSNQNQSLAFDGMSVHWEFTRK